MARRRGGGSGGLMRGAFTLVWILIVAGGVLGLFKANHINSVGEAWDYAHSWSQKTQEKYNECVSSDGHLTCDPGTGGGAGGSGDGTPPGGYSDLTPEQVKTLKATVSGLPTKPAAEVDYDRAAWPHWSDLNGNGCDTRQEAILAQGSGVKKDPSDPCEAVSGKWTSPYDGKTTTDPSTFDLDHVVPLGYAATHGGQEWPTAKKEQFANDLSQLLLVDASINRSKGDSGPADFMPEKSFQCSYAQVWTATVKKYGLWITAEDRTALLQAVGQC